MLNQLTWKPQLLIISLVAVLVMAAACATPPTTPTPTTPKTEGATPAAVKPTTSPPSTEATKPVAAPATKPTGEVVFAWPHLEEEIWDPSKSKPILRKAGGPIYESLYLPYPPNGEARPYLLEKGEMAADGLSWTLKLRDGVRFSNGDPLTAEDVKFSLDRYRSEASVSPQAAIFKAGIKDVEVVDRLTVKLLLQQPMIALPTMLAGSMGNEGIVLPKKYIEQVGWDGFEKKPIGSGPYRMVEHKPRQSVIYEAVENHWRTTPSFARIRVLAVPEERSRVAMLLSGQADLIDISPGAVKEVQQAGLLVKRVPASTEWHINFFGAFGQYTAVPTRKLEVRKALNLAINKKELLDALNDGVGEVAAYVPSVAGFTLGAPKGLQPTPYDPAEAKRLLQQAGYPDGFTITFYAANIGACLNYQRLAEAVAGYWQQIGVKTEIRPIEYGVLRPMFSGKEHDPKLVGAVSNHCSPTAAVASRDLNIYYWSKGIVKLTDVADAEIEQALAAKTTEELVQYSEAAYKKVYESYAVVPLLFGEVIYGVSKKMADVPTTRGFESLFVWLVADKP